ncbi:hypothetical protein GCM10022399_18900 [Terrabacter ginsenosidimutans]|jgi:hypothetical protein|uniref:DUF3846 domain-containing protein n=1 Tax=Terrabacter ginsenosidimutans TaxID=490575 RepID=A0ABP7DD24_9MICO
MTTYVRVDEDLFGRMGLKFVVTPDGQALELLPGQLAEPGADVISHVGEPRFQVRMSTPVLTDADVPDVLGLALRRVADRLFGVMPDGTEDPDASGIVEGVMGPAAHDGGLLLSLDTDGFGFNPPMLETMTRIFVEELEPLAIPVELCAASWVTDEIPPAWRSTADRLDG